MTSANAGATTPLLTKWGSPAAAEEEANSSKTPTAPERAPPDTVDGRPEPIIMNEEPNPRISSDDDPRPETQEIEARRSKRRFRNENVDNIEVEQETRGVSLPTPEIPMSIAIERSLEDSGLFDFEEPDKSMEQSTENQMFDYDDIEAQVNDDARGMATSSSEERNPAPGKDPRDLYQERLQACRSVSSPQHHQA